MSDGFTDCFGYRREDKARRLELNISDSEYSQFKREYDTLNIGLSQIEEELGVLERIQTKMRSINFSEAVLTQELEYLQNRKEDLLAKLAQIPNCCKF